MHRPLEKEAKLLEFGLSPVGKQGEENYIHSVYPC